MDEIVQYVELDVTHGMLLVHGVPFKMKVGVPIGSPIAAGVASLIVADKEDQYDAVLTREDRATLRRQSLRLRWLDDLLICISPTLPPHLKNHIVGAAHVHFYGETLTLARVCGREAFGFLLEEDDVGRLRARQRWQWLHKKMEQEAQKATAKMRGEETTDNGAVKMASGLPGGPQFRSRKVECSVAMGMAMRAMESTNQTSAEMQSSLIRLLEELKELSFGKSTLDQVVTSLTARVNFSLRAVRLTRDWPAKEKKEFCRMFDRVEQGRALRSRLDAEEDMQFERLIPT